MAKRVNTRFLAILAVAVVVMICGAVALSMLMTGGDAKEHVARGDLAMEKAKAAKDSSEAFENLKAAREAYTKALRNNGGSPDVIVKFGDVLHQIARYDPTMIGKDMQAWEEALQIDPGFVPALERLLETMIEVSRLDTSPGVFTRLAERAQALSRADGSNERAKIYEHVGTLGAWLTGKATAETTIDASVKALAALAEKHPAEPVIPNYIARAHLRRAQDFASANDPDSAKANREKALAVYSEAMKTQGENPQILFDYYQILTFLDQVERGGAAAAAAATEGRGEEAHRVLAKAAELARKSAPEDPRTVDILIAQARVLAGQGKGAEAEKAIEALHAQRPNDQRVRLEVARFWRANPARRRDAVDLLAKPLADDPSIAGFRALTMRGLEVRRLVDLTHLRLDTYEVAGESGGERSGLRQQIEEGYKRAAGLSNDESPEVLKLRGRILLLDGNVKATREAILAFQRATDKMEQAGYFDVELNLQLARVYQAVNQTGEARAILSKIVERRPTYVGGRKMLLDMMVVDGMYKAMEPHVAALERANPGDPDVARYRIIQHVSNKDLDKARAMVGAFPQETDQQRLAKAKLALIVGEPETTIALLAPLSEAELRGGDAGGRFPASNFLAQVYLREKRPEDARPVIDAALQRLPQDKGWQTLEAYASGRASPEELRKLDAMAIEAIEDPTQRALQQYRVLVEEQKPAEALKVLADAERQLPDAGQITEMIFVHGVDQRQWDVAERAAERLEKLNWDQAHGLYYRARLALARRDYEGAVRGALELSRKVPEFSRTWALLGQAQQATGQFESAIASYARALEKQPENFDALRGIVDCNINLDRVGVAREYVERGTRIGVGGAYFADVMKRLEERRGDPAAVTAQRERDVEQNPESLRARTALAENYLRVADALMSKNDQKGSLAYVEKARARLEEAVQKWPDEPQLYLQLADLVLRTGKVSEALQVADRLEQRERYKDRPEPYTLRSILLEQAGPEGVRKAEEALLVAVQRSDNAAEMRQRLADFYARTGQSDKAITIKAELLAASKDPVLRDELIQLQLGVGRYKEAEQLITDALSANRDDVRLVALLGSVQARQGNYDGAGETLRRAVKLDPQHAPARYYLGMLHRNRGEIASAISELQLAANLRPSDVPTRLALSEAYQMRNQPEDATRELELGLQAAPGDKALRERLFWLYAGQQRWTQAEHVLEQAKTNESLSRSPTWWQLESQMWAARGDARRMRQAAEIAYKKAPADPDVFYQYCAVLLNQGAYDELMAVTDGVPQQQRPWWMHMVRGMVWSERKDAEKAVGDFERAMSVVDTAGDDAAAERLVKGMTQTLGKATVVDYLSARKDVRWRILLAKTHQQNQDWPNAVRTMDELVQQDLPGLDDAQKLRVLSVGGLLYHAAGTSVPGALDKAERTYESYLELLNKLKAGNTARVQALNNLALLLAEHPVSPKVPEALKYSTLAYGIMEDLNRFDASIADTHGWVLVLADRVDEAIPLLQAAAAKEPPIPDPFYHLGEAYMRKSMPEEARNSLSRAKDLIKDFTDKGIMIDPSLGPKVDAALAKAKTMPASAASGT